MSKRTVTLLIPREWPTLLVLFLCYGVFLGLMLSSHWMSVWLTVPGLAVVLALHSSLQHEVLHGHPFKRQSLNEWLVFPALGLFIPYLRFKTTHLEHHQDTRLTDPYDDPESNYLDPQVWDRFSRLRKAIYQFNNTLLGRIVIGPVISLASFYRQDMKTLWQGDSAIAAAYGLHLIGLVIPLSIWYFLADISLWSYGFSAYLALSILKIRTFLEHRAHAEAAGRTVTIDDRGPLAFLFLNNNFHCVHHTHPRMPWYTLPTHYRRHRQYFDELNDGYTYGSYKELFVKYFLTTKDPVSHPLR